MLLLDKYENIVSELAKYDPIIKTVWEHYFVKKSSDPICPSSVKYFWQKITDEIKDRERILTTISKGQNIDGKK